MAKPVPPDPFIDVLAGGGQCVVFAVPKGTPREQYTADDAYLVSYGETTLGAIRQMRRLFDDITAERTPPNPKKLKR